MSRHKACDDCTTSERTLHDKLIVERLRSTSRKTRAISSGLVALGLVAASTAAGLAPAHAIAPADTSYGGFNTVATATPLKLEVFEPAIPIPTTPQFELDFSYTRVEGDTGPTSTARSSAMWPGPAIGEGLKTFGQQLGLPGALTDGGYPVQSNAQYPSDTTQAASEPLPGQIQRVNAGATVTTAKAGYSPSGDVSGGTAGSTGGSTSGGSTNPLTGLLSGLQGGSLSSLGSLLTGSQTGNETNPVSSNPLGDLSLLIGTDGMTSVSQTTYGQDSVTSTATSRIGELRLLLGLIKLDGINVVTSVTSSIAGGAVVSRTVDVGSMTILGQKFSYGPDGFTAAGKATPVPGLPTTAAALLKELGVEINVAPQPAVTKNGLSGEVDAEALNVVLDTKPLRSKLPSLPLDAIVNKLPDLPGQASVLKGLLLSLNTISPKLVLHLGQASASAATVPQVSFPGGGTPGGVGGTVNPPTSSGVLPPTGTGVLPGSTPPAGGTTPTVSPQLNPQAAIAGLPDMGSVPILLTLAGLALAAGIGYFLRQAGLLVFGGAAACTHGLKAGIPDLRKA
jgi:hypothetical protein